ncbi:HxlR family transcriptional regulator [Pedobacter nutrimenti]|uniref:HxlR family transcriptional regulator n=2 Tax=Pedobacter nutrimenti TaxID=1241337 RepID=A0A318U8U7_9SPHI|nr:HxlR family transcriptional regulator [Pedobacter nutrimenti]
MQVVIPMIMNRRSDCPLNVGLEIFGDKWTLLIIRDLMFFNKRYYNEFISSEEGISTNILADRLELLEKQGMVRKEKCLEHKQKILYKLTEKGIDLLPLIIEIGFWVEKNADEELDPNKEVILGPFRENREKGFQQIREKLRKDHLEKEGL